MLPAIVVPANDIDTPGLSLDVELGADWVTAQVEDAAVHRPTVRGPEGYTLLRKVLHEPRFDAEPLA